MRMKAAKRERTMKRKRVRTLALYRREWKSQNEWSMGARIIEERAS